MGAAAAPLLGALVQTAGTIAGAKFGEFTRDALGGEDPTPVEAPAVTAPPAVEAPEAPPVVGTEDEIGPQTGSVSASLRTAQRRRAAAQPGLFSLGSSTSTVKSLLGE